MLNVDGWTDGRTNERTNGRKLARLCLPAKAAATKSSSSLKIEHRVDLNSSSCMHDPSFMALALIFSEKKT